MPPRPGQPPSPADVEAQLLIRLDRIEDLIDEMDELQLFTRDAAEAERIAIHRQLDALDDQA